jgi:hypothetical protein
MTTPSAEAAPVPAAKPAALWEDFIDIFYAPSTVFERRRNANPWPMILIITVLVTAITVLTFNSLSPVYEAEFRAMGAKQMAMNPQITQDAIDKSLKFQMIARQWGGVFFPIGMLVFALPVWLLGRIVGAKELTYTRSLVVMAWSSIFGVLTLLVIGVQGLLMDVSAFTSLDQLSLSAARFVDKAATAPFVYGALKSVDVLQIWALIVMAIGVKVTGRSSKNGAIAYGVTWFVLASLIAGLIAMRSAM